LLLVVAVVERKATLVGQAVGVQAGLELAKDYRYPLELTTQLLLVLEAAQGLMEQILYLAPLHLPLGAEVVVPQIV
jgi:hypothetical protein